MKSILITNDPSLAADAEMAGVSRIMVDLESHGKKERQASRTTFISSHTKEDIAKIRAVLTKAELMVRINPWHEHSASEMDCAIANGADIIMLPMIEQMSQFDAFMACLAGRAGALPLIETAYSMEHLSEIASHKDISELYIGLNDLHLSLGLNFLFEPLAGGQLDVMAKEILSCGKAFGFGGIGVIGGEGELSPARILAEHARLGSACVILSTRFCTDQKIRTGEAQGRAERMRAALADLQNHYETLCARTLAQQENDFKETAAIIQAIAKKRKVL